ncbi:MlaE family ABC transporter permease [Anaeromyxobacter oryzae]|uniref:MlaE family ABC transporter permease n=1 Tax=Anaeromyxobacter oryzae TaxID=2918170 RepID=UPI0020BF2EC7|nr:ABC transporter permease [Anaeromyxobacter oryzae]
MLLRLGGTWRLADGLPGVDEVEREVDRARPPSVTIEGSGLGAWDSALVVFVDAVLEGCRARAIPVDASGLPAEVRRLVEMAQASAAPVERTVRAPSGIERLGVRALERHGRLGAAVAFIGETALALGRFASRRARFRSQDLWLLVQQCGAEALPIVALVNFLVGIILAFVGITQLRYFGAETYVADIVGIAVVRDMAALITGVTLSGRSGGAFAAQIATMNVTQEVDALRTFGISPVEFLVVPRVLALAAMAPFLTLFADATGILGGAVVGTTMLHQPFEGYVRQTALAVAAGDVVGGLVKGATYGLLIALTATFQGMQAERTAARVGDAATQAVVTGIVSIIAACGVYQYVFFLFGW